MAHKNFIAGAIKHPGALTEEAHEAGESPMEFAREHAHAPGKAGQRSRFALFLNRVRPTGSVKHKVGKPRPRGTGY